MGCRFMSRAGQFYREHFPEILKICAVFNKHQQLRFALSAAVSCCCNTVIGIVLKKK